MSKSSTHALAKSLAARSDIPEDSTVVTLLPDIIDTQANRDAMPDADKSAWNDPMNISRLVL